VAFSPETREIKPEPCRMLSKLLVVSPGLGQPQPTERFTIEELFRTASVISSSVYVLEAGISFPLARANEQVN
jgi:hypothetical protein